MTTKEEILNCNHGIYVIYWKSGGSSVASVGSLYSGKRWMAPANWTCPDGQNPGSTLEKWVDDIERMELVRPWKQDESN